MLLCISATTGCLYVLVTQFSSHRVTNNRLFIKKIPVRPLGIETSQSALWVAVHKLPLLGPVPHHPRQMLELSGSKNQMTAICFLVSLHYSKSFSWTWSLPLEESSLRAIQRTPRKKTPWHLSEGSFSINLKCYYNTSQHPYYLPSWSLRSLFRA